jgi:putative transposase
MDIVQHRTCTYQIGYHIVFCTKYRYKMLVGTVSEDLKRILAAVAKEKGFDIGEMAVGEDHVHLFITAPPHISVSSLVKWVKGISARRMFMKRPGLKKKLYKGHLWNPSYYVGTVGEIRESTVKRYIENQKTSYRGHE